MKIISLLDDGFERYQRKRHRVPTVKKFSNERNPIHLMIKKGVPNRVLYVKRQSWLCLRRLNRRVNNEHSLPSFSRIWLWELFRMVRMGLARGGREIEEVAEGVEWIVRRVYTHNPTWEKSTSRMKSRWYLSRYFRFSGIDQGRLRIPKCPRLVQGPLKRR